MRIFLPVILLFAIPLFAGAGKKLSPGDIVRVTVEVDDPGDLHEKKNSLTFGSFRETFQYLRKERVLTLVAKLPEFNRLASPSMNVELCDRAHNVIRFAGGSDKFEMPEIGAMKVDQTPPKIKSPKLERDKLKLTVSFEVEDESLAFANVQVISDLTAKEKRRFAFETATCEGNNPYKCKAVMELPDKLPSVGGGTLATADVGITVVDMGGNRGFLSSKENKALELAWERRAVREQDYETVSVGVRKVTHDKTKNTATIGFVARGGDGFYRATGSGKVMRNGPSRETLVFALDKTTTSCKDGDCDVTFALPPKLPSRNFQIELQVFGNNGRSDRIGIEKQLVDVSNFVVDTDPPKLKSVKFEPATRDELEGFPKQGPD